MTMLEKVAKAIEDAELGNNWNDMARAAINAMREPSTEMLDAGWNAAWPEGSKFTRPPLYVWEDMISAALDEPPPS